MRDARHQDIADQEQQHRKGQHSRAVHQTLGAQPQTRCRAPFRSLPVRALPVLQQRQLLLSCFLPPFENRECQIDEQNEYEQYNAGRNKCLTVQAGGVAHLKHDVCRQVRMPLSMLPVSRGWLPATMITAMVSPMARPMPSTMPASTPDLAAGTITVNIARSCRAPWRRRPRSSSSEPHAAPLRTRR